MEKAEGPGKTRTRVRDMFWTVGTIRGVVRRLLPGGSAAGGTFGNERKNPCESAVFPFWIFDFGL
jgi:hypothetical protein